MFKSCPWWMRMSLLLLHVVLWLRPMLGRATTGTRHFPEDVFARRRQQQLEQELLSGTDDSKCVPLVSSVGTDDATLLNGSHVPLGAWTDSVGHACAGAGRWRLVALAPVERNPSKGANLPAAAVWEQHATQDIWGISFVSSQAARSGIVSRRPSVALAKPVGSPSAITYPSTLPPWFVGTYWRQTVLPSAQDVLADRMLSEDTVSYDQIASVLPRLTGQMGETLESVRHRGGPSFVSDPSSDKWWQVRQNGEVVIGDTVSKEGTAALAVLHHAFQPRPVGFKRPDRACEWPNHDGPAPTHGPACMHVQGLLGGWLPIINQGLRDTNGGSAVEQLVLASGDSLYLGNRSGTARGGWGQWSFFLTPENQTTHLQQATPSQFLAALLKVVLDAKTFIEGTTLSESRLQIPAEPLLADAARASLLLARSTYTELHPHYGIGSSYWTAVNDGFPPTTLAMVHTLCSVGAASAAADRLGYFLQHLVNSSTGAVIYYGTAISEYGQLLQAAATVVAGLESSAPGTGHTWLTNHGVPLGKIVERLLSAQSNASAHRNVTGGLLWGCPEADLCRTPSGQGLFFASGLWAWRGLVDMAAVLGQLGLTVLGNGVRATDMNYSAVQLQHDTLSMVATSVEASGWLPPCHKCSVSSAFENMTESRIASYTNYRFWPEMLSSGGLPSLVAEGLGRYRQSHGGELLGMTRFEQWVDDWPVADVALWWLSLEPNSTVGSAERFSIATLAHLAHHSTRGTFTAFEQANYADNQADNCVPSQLVVPTLLTHMLVHVTQTEGVVAEKRVPTIWLHRGVPRHWFASSAGGFRVANVSVWAPGKISTTVQIHDRSAVCTLTIVNGLAQTTDPLPFCNVVIWPGGYTNTTVSAVEVNGKVWTDVDGANAIVRNVPCVSPRAGGASTTTIVVQDA